MARPTKQGIDYFPLDCVFDDDLQLFITENGADSLGILVVVWQMIYQNEGYFIQNDKKFPLKVKQRIMSDVDRINEVISNAVEWGVFDKSIYNKHKILTSKGIQKRFFIAARLKKEVKIHQHLILINIDSVGNAVNVVGNDLDIVGNATNVKEDVNVNVKENKSICPAPCQAQDLMIIGLPTNKFNTQQEQYSVTESQLAEWSETYPAVDVDQTLKRIRSWLVNNPSKRKTMRGMGKFIDSWLSREQDRGNKHETNRNNIKQVAGSDWDTRNDLDW